MKSPYWLPWRGWMPPGQRVARDRAGRAQGPPCLQNQTVLDVDVVLVRSLQVLLNIVHVPVVRGRIPVNITCGIGREHGRRADTRKRTTRGDARACWSRVGASRPAPAVRPKPVHPRRSTTSAHAAARRAPVRVAVGVTSQDEADLLKTAVPPHLAQIGGLRDEGTAQV